MKFIIIVLFSMSTVLLANTSFAEKSDSTDSIQKMVGGIIEELSQSVKRNKELTREKEALKREIEELTKANQSLKRELEKAEEKKSVYSALQKRLGEYQSRIIKLIQEKEQLKEEKNLSEEKLNDYQARLVESDTKIKELEQELADAQKEEQNILQVKSSLEEKAHSYEELNKQLQETLAERQAKLTEAKDKIKEFALKEKELENYKTVLAEIENRIIKLIQEKEQLEEEKNLSEEKLIDYQARLVESDTKIKKLEQQLEIIQKKKEAQKEEWFKSFYELGRTFAQEKKYKEAAKNFEECVKLKPNDAKTHYNLGVIYQYEYGDRKSAIYHLKKYLELNPKAKDRKDVEFLVELLER